MKIPVCSVEEFRSNFCQFQRIRLREHSCRRSSIDVNVLSALGGSKSTIRDRGLLL